MRFHEIFEDVSSEELIKINNLLNSQVWMPDSMMNTDGPVIKLVLPRTAHFAQRAAQRGETSNINAKEIAMLLAAAKSDPSNPFYDQLQRFAYEDNAHHTIQVKDPVSGLSVPLSIEHNKDAYYSDEDKAVASDRRGKLVPKNVAIAKTIMRRSDISPVDTNAHHNSTYNDKNSERARQWNRYSDLATGK